MIRQSNKISLALLGLFFALYPLNKEKLFEEIEHQGVSIDLIDPSFEEGVLSTEKGGVIKGPSFRLQANKLSYSGKEEGEEQTSKVFAEGNVALIFGDKTFLGQALEYDFLTQKGVLTKGKTGIPPWYFGAEVIFLEKGGDAELVDAFITASERAECEWLILSDNVLLKERKSLVAKNVRFTLFGRQVFYLNSYKTELNAVFDSPFRYTMQWGGEEGFRLGFMYEVFNAYNLKTFTRLDYRARRGFGGGIETRYLTDDCSIEWRTINYVARDKTIVDPDKKTRYRFLGLYKNRFSNEKTDVSLTYDKLSDMEMPTDYSDKTLQIKSADRTEFWVRHQENFHITNFLTRVRINDFQTVNQELPSLTVSGRPYLLNPFGVIFDGVFSAKNLDYVYSSDSTKSRDYAAFRAAFSGNLYKPLKIGTLKLLPQIGCVNIFYSNSPEGNERLLTTALFSLEAETSLYRIYPLAKHLIYPYAKYTFITYPSVEVDDHYIFNINDGWYRLNQLNFGIRQDFIASNLFEMPYRLLTVNLFANAFFDTETIRKSIPKAYLDITLYPTMRSKVLLSSGWDFENNLLDHINTRLEWTVSDNLAFSFEYLHRSPFSYRKADRTNFILESYRDQESLFLSGVSDRRDTFLYKIYYRLHPILSFQGTSRCGWNRVKESSYLEFQADLIAKIRTAWNVQATYQHRESDKKFALYTWLGFDEIFPCCEPKRVLEF